MSKTNPDAFMPLWIADYLADTTHLTCEQHGAYFLLLMTYWRRGGHMPADNACLASITKLSPQKWRTMRVVMEKFFREDGGQWKNKRADAEILKASKLQKDKAAAGKKGAEKRWSGHSSAIDQPSENIEKTIAENSPTPSPTERKKDSEVRTSEPVGSSAPVIELFAPKVEQEPIKPPPPPPVLLPFDFKKQVFASGVPLLVTNDGMDPKHARSMIASWRNQYGDAEVMNALASAQGNAVTQIVPYVQKILRGKSNGRPARQYGPARNGSDHALGGFAQLKAEFAEVPGADGSGDYGTATH